MKLLASMKKIDAASRGILVSVSLLFGLTLWLWADHAQLLQTAARLWVVNDPVETADAVAIFGGGIETRPAAAAGYLRHGMVRKILLTHSDADFERSSSHSHTEQNLAELKKLGVTDESIEIIGCNLSSTYQEALALKHWSLATKARSVIVPTEYFSTRRVRWITQKVFEGTGVQVRVPVTSPPYYLRGEWWEHIDAPLAFGREVFKYAGYRLVYGLLTPWYEPDISSARCAH